MDRSDLNENETLYVCREVNCPLHIGCNHAKPHVALVTIGVRSYQSGDNGDSSEELGSIIKKRHLSNEAQERYVAHDCTIDKCGRALYEEHCKEFEYGPNDLHNN